MEYNSEDCKEPHKLRKDDLVIAIMGPTGTGKSNIIDNLTGQLGKRVGHSLKSCTTVVGAVRIKNHRKYGDRIVLVDTPGFDDTEKSDLEILRIISDWLIKLCQARVFLCGIVYLHRITDTRMSGSHQRNLSMLGELCGTCAAKKVTLVTTMWDHIEPNDLDFGKKWEDDLKSTYWKPLLDQGASTARFRNTKSSAWEIIGDILAKPVENITLYLQQEMASLRRPLEETDAVKKLEFRSSMEDNLRTQQPNPTPKKNLGKKRLYLQSKLMQAGEEEWEQYQFINYPALKLSSSSYMSHGQAKRITAEDLSPEDFVIAVMGPSGSGKTTFINIATGLQSGFRYSQRYTNEVDIIRLPVPGSSNIVFVDIPGFDDGDKSDADTLKMIGDWLSKIYRRKIMLGGILYFHRISDNRVGGGSLKNLNMFEALCGRTMLQNVILTTTMWDGIDEKIAMMREGQLKELYWARMLEHGSTTKRFLLTKQSAFQVLETLFNTPSELQPLLVQKQIVDEHMELNETTAGRKLWSDLKEVTKKHRGLLRRMRAQLKPAKDGDSGNLMVLKEEYEDLKELTNLVAYNVQQLELPVGQRIARMAATAFGLKLH